MISFGLIVVYSFEELCKEGSINLEFVDNAFRSILVWWGLYENTTVDYFINALYILNVTSWQSLPI